MSKRMLLWFLVMATAVVAVVALVLVLINWHYVRHPLIHARARHGVPLRGITQAHFAHVPKAARVEDPNQTFEIISSVITVPKGSTKLHTTNTWLFQDNHQVTAKWHRTDTQDFPHVVQSGDWIDYSINQQVKFTFPTGYYTQPVIVTGSFSELPEYATDETGQVQSIYYVNGPDITVNANQVQGPRVVVSIIDADSNAAIGGNSGYQHWIPEQNISLGRPQNYNIYDGQYTMQMGITITALQAALGYQYGQLWQEAKAKAVNIKIKVVSYDKYSTTPFVPTGFCTLAFE